MINSDIIISKLLSPKKLWTRNEILQKPSQVPLKDGIYAWYFKKLPNIDILSKYFNVKDGVLQECHQYDGYQLLYVGVAPASSNSNNNLRKRLKDHMNGNAYGSTLRLSLGCLLSDELDIKLKKVGKSSVHFRENEEILSEWMQNNAFVTFEVCHEPWKIEDEAIKTINLPLNIKDNESSPFFQPLKDIRKKAKSFARKQ